MLERLSKQKSSILINKSFHKNYVPKISKSFAVVEISVSVKFLTSFLATKKAKKILKIYQEFINDRLNVINILQKLEIIDIYFSQYKNLLDNFNDNNSLDKK